MRILIIICLFIWQFNASATRGWYASIGVLSSQQKHDIAKYQSGIISNITASANSPIATISNTSNYYFGANTTSQVGLLDITVLQNALSGKYIHISQTFVLNPSGTGVPAISSTSGSTTSTTSGSTTSTTVVFNGSTIFSMVPNTTTSGNYNITLSPVNYSSQIALLNTAIATEVTSTHIDATQQLQDFINAFQEKSSGGEISIGYKFRPFQSRWFISPQLDLTYYNNSSQKTAYTNTAKSTFQKTSDTTHITKITRNSLDLSLSTSIVAKIGYERQFLFGTTKLPLNIYGLIGGSSSMRKYHDVRANNLGLKYGVGGEIFLSKHLALFGELYQISFIDQNIDSTNTHPQTTSASLTAATTANTGNTITVTNSQTGAGDKSFNIQYPSLAQSINNNGYTVKEGFAIQTRLSAFKAGLVYYF
ncbi:MAG: hypothetical protein ACI9CD_000907 [Candidatus Deianiraeaceae bacterium]|jgi:hypothetical protein